MAEESTSWRIWSNYRYLLLQLTTDGASSDGSDAIAGVINVITKKGFDGAEFNFKEIEMMVKKTQFLSFMALLMTKVNGNGRA